jgi:hypothetical protein
MGPPPSIVALAPLSPKEISKVKFSDEELTLNSEFSDYVYSEVSDSDLVEPYPPRCLWDKDSLQAFTLICTQTANDTEFDKLNNKLLIALKLHTPHNRIYCSKCKKMTSVTKRGKTNKTYQFACGSHTISASQILESLPEGFLLAQIPSEPADVFIQTLDWLSKPHLSPELLARASKRNATKRFSFHRSPERIAMPPGVIKTRSHSPENSTELIIMKQRLAATETTMKLLAEQNEILLASNKRLSEEIQILKRFMIERPQRSPAHKPSESHSSSDESSSSYANVSQLHRPVYPTKRHFTKSYTATPLEIISARPLETKTSPEYSPLTFVFFEGCHRKNAADYRKLIEKCDLSKHIARDITFLAEDLLQITTFEDKKDDLIAALTSISPQVKHLPVFDPKLGQSYKKYGVFSDEQAEQGYFSLLAKNVKRLEKEIRYTPSLKRVTGFLKKVIESKTINYQSPVQTRRVFCLGDFIPSPKLTELDMDLEPIEETAPIHITADTLIEEQLASAPEYETTKSELDISLNAQ